MDDFRQHTLLSCWMAHRIAELMLRAQEAPADQKVELQQECADLILRVWNKRNYWPHGSPVERALELLEAIDSRPNFEPSSPHPSREHDESVAEPAELKSASEQLVGQKPNAEENGDLSQSKFWMAVAGQVDKLGEKERLICRNAAFALLPEVFTNHLQEWLKLEAALGNDERELLGRLERLIEQNRNGELNLGGERAPGFLSLSPRRQARLILKVLLDISHERGQLLLNVERKCSIKHTKHSSRTYPKRKRSISLLSHQVRHKKRRAKQK